MGLEQGKLAGLLNMLIGRQKGCTGQSNSSRSRESLSDDKNLGPSQHQNSEYSISPGDRVHECVQEYMHICMCICVHVFMCVFRIQKNVQG